LFMSMRIAAFWGQPLQARAVRAAANRTGVKWS